MTADAIFRLRGISVTLGGRTVLQVPDLDFHDGRCTCLVGPNGSGKTVTLSLLAGLLAPAAGTLTFRGKRIDGEISRRTMRKTVTLVHQSPYLFRGSVLANVAFGLKVRKVPRQRRQDLAGEALERVGLAGFSRRDARGLSGGEVQRVAMARAVACRPDVYLFDEPTASIDSHSVELIERTITSLTEGGGATVVFTTHDAAQARRLGERLLFLNEGRLFEGTERNLLRGTVRAEGGETVFDTGRIRLAVPWGRDGQRGFLAIDERAVTLTPGRERTGGSGLHTGSVVSLAAENGLVRVEVSVEGERLALSMNPEKVLRLGISPGKEVTLHIPSESTQLC